MTAFDQVREIVLEILELEDHELLNDKPFTEYDFDSLLALDILSALEKAFKIRIPEDDISRLVDVNGTIALIEAHTEMELVA
jgi:acyl carrier protein